MKLGIAKDGGDETRVAIVPGSLKKLVGKGFEVIVEAGAGARSMVADEAYVAAGATIGSAADVRQADLVASIRRLDPATLAPGAMHVCIADPFRDTDGIKACLERKTTLLALDMIPRRLSRAQSMDVNSSQDNLAGYKAVMLGAGELGKVIPMMTTSAGSVRPAKFVIMGSGVAGLQAIATAKRLGAVVYASDVRLAAKEQIESVGGRFIHVDGMEDFEDASGYAKPLTPEFIEKVNGVVNEVASDADVVVTTARIFGRRAPVTVPASAVEAYKAGAVIVDMNADTGGNCELTMPGQRHRTASGVTVLGFESLPGLLPQTASMLFSNNVTNFVTTLVKEDALHLDLEDPILVGPPEGDPLHVPGMGGILVCHDGAIDERQTRLEKVIA
ncbi:MAG: NAD(P) transhydrogenase subunit alpha [Myxococcota bacterium]